MCWMATIKERSRSNISGSCPLMRQILFAIICRQREQTGRLRSDLNILQFARLPVGVMKLDDPLQLGVYPQGAGASLIGAEFQRDFPFHRTAATDGLRSELLAAGRALSRKG